MTSKLAEILFKGYRRRVLGLLLLKPDSAYHVRQIARLTNTQAGTLHKELARLADGDILTKRQQGNQVTYQANRQCIIFEELAGILRKTSGMADILANALSDIADQIDVAVVFGSIASGKATTFSDIDLLIIGDISFTEAVKRLYPVQSILAREINPKVYTINEWCEAVLKDSVFIRELLTKPIIEIIGGKDDLRKLGGAKSGAD